MDEKEFGFLLQRNLKATNMVKIDGLDREWIGDFWRMGQCGTSKIGIGKAQFQNGLSESIDSFNLVLHRLKCLEPWRSPYYTVHIISALLSRRTFSWPKLSIIAFCFDTIDGFNSCEMLSQNCGLTIHVRTYDRMLCVEDQHKIPHHMIQIQTNAWRFSTRKFPFDCFRQRRISMCIQKRMWHRLLN